MSINRRLKNIEDKHQISGSKRLLIKYISYKSYLIRCYLKGIEPDPEHSAYKEYQGIKNDPYIKNLDNKRNLSKRSNDLMHKYGIGEDDNK